MRERPILFPAPMVRAILEGRKTQTRRVVKGLGNADRFGLKPVPCRYGQPGDRLWVKETWRPWPATSGTHAKFAPLGAQYAADIGHAYHGDQFAGRWKPSIHMPRRFSRLTLEITEVRVQRLQDISEEDARAEGVAPVALMVSGDINDPRANMGRLVAFYELWNSINAKRGFGWDSNPWVWAISFRRATPEKDSGRQG